MESPPSTLYNWLHRYRAEGLDGMADRYKRQASRPELLDFFRIQRKVSAVGNTRFSGTQYNLGRRFAGQVVTVVIDGDLLRFCIAGQVVKVYRRPARGEHGYQSRAVALERTAEVIHRLHARRTLDG